MRRPHLGEHLVEPLQGPREVHFDPAGRGGDVLAVVLRAPALDKAHADRAHLRQLVDRLEAVVHRHRQQLRKFPVVEDLQAAARRNLADRGRVKLVRVVAVSALHKNGTVTEALGVDFPSNVVQVDAFANVPARVLDGGVAVDVGQQAEAEAVAVVGGVGEAVNDDAVVLRVEDLAHPRVQLVVRDVAPVLRLLVRHRRHVRRNGRCVH